MAAPKGRQRYVMNQDLSSSEDEVTKENLEQRKTRRTKTDPFADKRRVKTITRNNEEIPEEEPEGPPLDIHSDVKKHFNKRFKCTKVTKNTNTKTSSGDCINPLLFPFHLYITQKNERRAKNWVMKLEVLGEKIAVHGLNYLHCDDKKRNEYALYRLDGKLTLQSAHVRYEDDNQTTIYKSDKMCWMETDEKTNGIKLFEKCLITDEILAMTRLQAVNGEDGQFSHFLIKNTRYPDGAHRQTVNGEYYPTTEKAISEVIPDDDEEFTVG